MEPPSWMTGFLSARLKSFSYRNTMDHKRWAFIEKLNWLKLGGWQETGQQAIYSCSVYGGRNGLSPFITITVPFWIYDYQGWNTKSTAAFNNKPCSSFVSINRFNKREKKNLKVLLSVHALVWFIGLYSHVLFHMHTSSPFYWKHYNSVI